MNRPALFLFLAALLFAVPAFADTGEYVFILIARGNPYWTAMADGIQDEARVKTIKATIYNTNSSTDVEQQLNLCQTAIQSHPKAIVMAAINGSVAAECFKMAAANGVVFADVDGSFSIADAKKAGLDMAFSVGSDNYAIGQAAAKYMTGIAGKSDPEIFILEGTVGSMQARKRADGFRDKLKEILPHARIVASISADFDRLKATNMTFDFLQRQPNLDFIYAANDGMALGAAEAVRNLHREDKIGIIGVDGTADARKAIESGRITATVAQLPYLMGKRSVDMAINAVATGARGVSETTATPVVTAGFLKAGNDPLLQYIR